jgi:hypothetical protein
MPNKTEFLKKAKKSKKDEFYTQLSDIEKELRHYKIFFKNKAIFCNCDDPRVSNFFHYFSYNFEKLGLKNLITTCYKNQSADLFSTHNSEKAIYLEYTGDKNGNNVPDPEEIGIIELKGDGDFRSNECIELLKKSDVVITNPPFSLFRDYVKQLIEYEKKFLIIGHQNAISYKEIFKLIKEDKIWLGYGFNRNMAHFINPHYEDYASDVDHKEGMIRVSGVVWFTNIDTKKRHEDLILYKTYYGNEKEFPPYCNYDAINVDKVKEIPMDFEGKIGVPITFIDKYNPDQFEIIALGIVGSIEFNSNRKMEILDKEGTPTGKFTNNAKGTLYRMYDPERDKKPAAFKDCETGDLYSSIYARIIIKNKKPQK